MKNLVLVFVLSIIKFSAFSQCEDLQECLKILNSKTGTTIRYESGGISYEQNLVFTEEGIEFTGYGAGVGKIFIRKWEDIKSIHTTYMNRISLYKETGAWYGGSELFVTPKPGGSTEELLNLLHSIVIHKGLSSRIHVSAGVSTDTEAAFKPRPYVQKKKEPFDWKLIYLGIPSIVAGWFLASFLLE